MHNVTCWVHSSEEASEQDRDNLTKSLAGQGVTAEPLLQGSTARLGVCVFGCKTPELQGFLRIASKRGQLRVIAVADSRTSLNEPAHWDLLQAGASDVLVGSDPDQVAREIRARFERWLSVELLMEEPTISDLVVAKSPAWRTLLRDVVEIARFSNANVLILGETGTGQRNCSTAYPSARPKTGQARPRGSRLFHCRTGAVGERVLWS